MQYRLTFTVGLDIDRKGMDITPMKKTGVMIGLRQYMADNFGGATFLDGYGVWNGGPNNSTVEERVTHIIVDAWIYTVDVAKHHAEELAKIGLQQSVHMSMTALYAVDVSHTGVVTE